MYYTLQNSMNSQEENEENFSKTVWQYIIPEET